MLGQRRRNPLPKMESVGAIMNKVLRAIHALLKERRTVEEEYRSRTRSAARCKNGSPGVLETSGASLGGAEETPTKLMEGVRPCSDQVDWAPRPRVDPDEA